MYATEDDLEITEIPLETRIDMPPSPPPPPSPPRIAEQPVGRDYFTLLPNEILHEIIEYLIVDATTNRLTCGPLLRLRQLNRRLRTATDNDIFWSRLFAQTFPQPYPHRAVFLNWFGAYVYEHQRRHGRIVASPIQTSMRRNFDILVLVLFIYALVGFSLTLALRDHRIEQYLAFPAMNAWILLVPVYDYAEVIYHSSPAATWSFGGYLAFGWSNAKFKAWWTLWFVLLALSLAAVFINDRDLPWIKILMGINYPLVGIFELGGVSFFIRLATDGFQH